MSDYLFNLRFDKKDIIYWHHQYKYKGDNEEKLARFRDEVRLRGYLTLEQFQFLVDWKSSRPAKHHAKNDEETIREVTKLAFATKVESLRLRALMLLEGVEVRTASAILHFCHNDPYPIFDKRAIWSLGIESAPTYWLGLWDRYVAACREIAKDANVTMRVLDRALWAYSAKHQPK
jgi:hypothetical protein